MKNLIFLILILFSVNSYSQQKVFQIYPCVDDSGVLVNGCFAVSINNGRYIEVIKGTSTCIGNDLSIPYLAANSRHGFSQGTTVLTQLLEDACIVTTNDGGAFHQDNTGSTIPLITLTDPTVPVTPIAGDFVLQQYDNGVVYSIYDGISWTNVDLSVSVMIDTNSNAVRSSIARHISGSGIIVPIFETVSTLTDNGDRTYTYDDEFPANPTVDIVLDGGSFYQDNTITVIPGTLVDPTVVTTPINGDFVLQEYSDGFVFSTYDGTIWTNKTITTAGISVQDVTNGLDIQMASNVITIAPSLDELAPLASIDYANDRLMIWDQDLNQHRYINPEDLQGSGGFSITENALNTIKYFTDTTSNGTIYQDSICIDTFYRDNYFVFRGDTLSYWEYTINIDCSLDSFETVFCKDTIHGGYLELRTIPSRYICDEFYLQDWELIAPDGSTMQMLGGVFRKGDSSKSWKTLTEDGGTVIQSEIEPGLFYERDWDYIHAQPEWWEAGGYDVLGLVFTDQLASSSGIYNETDRLNSVFSMSRIHDTGNVVELLNDKTYPVDQNIFYSENTLNMNNATLQRIDEVVTTSTSTVGVGTTSFTVTDPTGFRAGDLVVLAGAGGAPIRATIISVAGSIINTIPFSGTGGTVAAGGTVLKEVTILSPFNLGPALLNEVSFRMNDGNINGNKDNNSTYIHWSIAGSVNYQFVKDFVCDNIYFYDIPCGNTNGGGNASFRGCEYKRLNGGVDHNSNTANHPFREFQKTFLDCEGDSIGIQHLILGHEEGIYTSSLNHIGLNVVNNKFTNVFNGITSADVDDGDISTFNITDSYFEAVPGGNGGAGGVTASISTVDTNLVHFSLKNSKFINFGEFVFRGRNMQNGFAVSNVEFDNCDFVNSWITVEQAANIEINNCDFYVDDSYPAFANFSATAINSDRATILMNRVADVKITNNELYYSAPYTFEWQAGIIVRPLSVATNNPNHHDVFNVNISNNLVHNFGVGISSRGWGFVTTNIAALNDRVINNMEIKNNVVVTNESGSVFQGVGIEVYNGVRALRNTIYNRNTTAMYGLLVHGLTAASPALTNYIGGYAEDNIIYTINNARAIRAGTNGNENIVCINNKYTATHPSASFTNSTVNSYVPLLATDAERNLELLSILPNLSIVTFTIPIQKTWIRNTLY